MGTMETMGEQEQLRWGRWGYLYENQNNSDGDDGDDGRTRTIEMGTMGILVGNVCVLVSIFI